LRAERLCPSCCSSEQPFLLYRLSYLYFNVLGCLIVIVAGLVASFLTGATNPSEVNPDLLSPVVHWTLPKKRSDEYRPVKRAEASNAAR
jgi:hypothetical protein